jgi:integrase
MPPLRRQKGRPWSSEEARRFLESAKAEADPLYAAYVLVLGLRKGDVLGLSEDDVDLVAGELHIGRQLQRVGRQLLHRETKTEGSAATVPLPDVCAAALQDRAAVKNDDRRAADVEWQGSPCCSRRSTAPRSSPRTFNRAWDRR